MLEQKMLDFALLGAEWVLWVLVALSVVCIAVAFERAVFAAMNTSPLGQLQQALNEYIKNGDGRTLFERVKDMKGMEARVLAAGIEAANEGGAPAAEEAMAGAITFEKIKLERGLIVLGTTGSNAPFIGLFGTVLGIIRAFNDLALESAEAAGSVMAGISEALVATAIGLLVAIPAVVLYNVFMRRNKEALARIESLGHHMLARIKTPSSTEALKAQDLQAQGA